MNTGSRIERRKYGRDKANQPKKKGPRNILKKIVVFIVAIFFGLILAGGALFTYYASRAPSVSELDFVDQVSSKILDKHGQLIKEIGAENRDLMTKEEMTPLLKDAVLAIEDARFYQHHGIDPIRIGGALTSNLMAGDIVEGGSTITQQLIKLSVFSTDFKDQTLERKAQEAWLALQVESQYSKDDILTYYLNKLFYSNNVYGVKTAARVFFNKSLNELNLAEVALLAGIPQAPSEYDPYHHPEAAEERRNLVLRVMLDRQLISDQQYQEAINQSVESMLVEISPDDITDNDLMVDSFIDVVAKEVEEKLNLNVFTDGLVVHTTLDLATQEFIYQLVNDNRQLDFPNDQLQTAISIVNAETGELQAIIGGRKQETLYGMNRANSKNRTVASTIKPLSVYGPAIEYLNYSTGQLVVDEPYRYSNNSPIENYDFEYLGNQTLREALSGSRNIPALKVLQEVGLENANKFLQQMDIQIKNNDRQELVEANAIGGEISPIELSAAYATIANYGQYHKPYTVTKVETLSGDTHNLKTESRQAMKDTTAYMLVDILKGVPGNFAPNAEVKGIYHAGKTGTSNYSEDQYQKLGIDPSVYAAPDSWYAGFTPQYAIATWVGYDNPYQAGNYLTFEDTRLPSKIYAKTIEFLMKDTPIVDWTRPANISEVEIEKYTNPIMLPGPYTPSTARSRELFIRGKEPSNQSQAYGRYIEAPTSFDANYNEEKKQIEARWSGPAGSTFELSLNGSVIYTGSDQGIAIPLDHPVGEYTLRLRIISGNSSSDFLVVTLTFEAESSEESSESTDESERSTDETQPTESQSEDEQTEAPSETDSDEYNPY